MGVAQERSAGSLRISAFHTLMSRDDGCFYNWAAAVVEVLQLRNLARGNFDENTKLSRGLNADC